MRETLPEDKKGPGRGGGSTQRRPFSCVMILICILIKHKPYPKLWMMTLFLELICFVTGWEGVNLFDMALLTEQCSVGSRTIGDLLDTVVGTFCLPSVPRATHNVPPAVVLRTVYRGVV